MHVKIDTKERFHEFTVLEAELTANMAVELTTMLAGVLEMPIKNLILNLENTKAIDGKLAGAIVDLQTKFYDEHVSFVICGIQSHLEEQLDAAGQLELMNFTPTLSEAWDIVQMEEIERELLDGF
ncbi:MAG: STAS domain-containing protein [Bacteroidetes bacterium]|nr:MAG: STAS domain-containing protein [Bacteroidota bacterium]